jgi:lipoprotein-releasing system permease protein
MFGGFSLPVFISGRVFGGVDGGRGFSSPAVGVATASMGLGVAVMILSVAIVVGFKREVRNKVIGFGSHIQIGNFDGNNSYETEPVCVSDSLIRFLELFPNVKRVERFAVKPGMVKTDGESQAMVFKGVDDGYDWGFFRRNMIEGRIPNIRGDSVCNEVMVSGLFARRMGLGVGDSFITYFVGNEGVRLRKFGVSGIYGTGFSDYDGICIFVDIKQIVRINGWDGDMVSGLEVLVSDYDGLDLTTEALFLELQVLRDRLGSLFYVRSVKELNPSIFAWLDVLDVNIWVIMVLMLLVAGFSMVSGLLIIILERAGMIGVLKTLGQCNGDVRRIFMCLAVRLVGKGLAWGNLIAVSVCLLQKWTGVIRLNPDVYYLSEMPVDINVCYILIINVGVFLASLMFLILPSMIVSGVLPAKSIRFE